MSVPELHATDDLLLLQALIDGELDAASMIALERRLANEPKLAADHARLLALRNVIRLGAPREEAPADLRARIAALGAPSAAADAGNVVPLLQPAARSRSTTYWRNIAGALAAALALMIGANVYLVVDGNVTAGDATARSVVASHMRGVIAGQPVDVVSTDRHTVKPWLAGKVPLATAVVDLAADGYALAGGRVDIVDGEPAATLVYRYREHLISVTELNRDAALSTERREMIEGHPVVLWSDSSRRYIAVSDMAAGELDQFVAVFQRAAVNAEEDSAPAH